MFVITLTYVKPLSDVDEQLDSHIQFLNKYYDSGHFLLSGGQVPRKGGVILAKGNDLNEIQDIIKQDPFHIKGIAQYDVVEFKPTKANQDLAGLINN